MLCFVSKENLHTKVMKDRGKYLGGGVPEGTRQCYNNLFSHWDGVITEGVITLVRVAVLG